MGFFKPTMSLEDRDRRLPQELRGGVGEITLLVSGEVFGGSALHKHRN